MRHGLTSQRLRDALRGDVEALIPALIGGAHADPPVIDAARAAAEAILHLHHVKKARYAAIDELRKTPKGLRVPSAKTMKRLFGIIDGTLKVAPGEDLDEFLAEVEAFLGDGAEDDEASSSRAIEAMTAIMAKAPKELRRIADYERRALSARSRALRRLECERIEAERRRMR